MNALQQFLMENPVDNIKDTIIVSERLKDYPFEVRAITGSEHNNYQTACIENANSPKKRKFNSKRFNELIVLNHTVSPNFKDAEWVAAAGVSGPEALLYKSLLAGEITTLADSILKLSGFSDEDMAADVDEVKN